MNRQVEKAKKFPITSLYKGDLKRSGNALIGKCILHKDDNPSLAIYEATNSFFCFAEGKGGDSIQFYMLLKDVNFKQAVKALNR